LPRSLVFSRRSQRRLRTSDSRRKSRPSVADNGCYLVAEKEGQIVGHGILDPLPLAATRHVVHLTLVTHPGWQHQGVGRELLSGLIEWAKTAQTVEKIELHVRSSNESAQALYRKTGSRRWGR
jgi:ribosomal protein S18 acetylase RimI-like enzyme